MEEFQYIGAVGFGQKKQIEQIRSAYSHELSSHAFASLYLWENYLGLTLYLADGFFTVKCGRRGENAWFFPCGDDEMKKAFFTRHLGEEDLAFCYLRDEDKEFLEKYYKGCFELTEEESSSEYIYDRKEYELICGKRFANMRKQINRLQKEHKVEVKKICDENIHLAWEIFGTGFLKTADVAKKALRYRRELDIFGILVLADDIVQSLVLGFPLTKDTIDGCIECSNMSVHGLSYFSKRAFFLTSNEQYQFMNAEEDLGIMGLRMAKRRMGPIRQNRIWNAARRIV